MSIAVNLCGEMELCDYMSIPPPPVATIQALLGILLNNSECLELGEVLTSFRSFTM